MAQIERLGLYPISRVKVDTKNYNQHFINLDENNNSLFKTFFKSKFS